MTEVRIHNTDTPGRARRVLFAQALLSAVLASLLAIVVLDVDPHEWRVPIHDSGDALLHQMMIRSVIDHGASFQNPHLNAPFGLDLRDFPAWDILTLTLARLISIFTHDVGLVTNLTFLITFPLLAASTFLTLRWVGLSAPFAFAGALIYTFIPYHLIKGVGHLFLSNFVLVPPALALALATARGDTLRRRHYVAAVITGLLLGLNGVYYPAFTLVVLALASLLRIVRDRNIRGALAAIVMILVTVSVVVAGLLPVVQRRAETGGLEAGVRHHAESELYALKPAAMILPVQGHRLSGFGDLRDRYSAAPLYYENDTVAIGLVGVAGLAALLLHLIRRLAGAAPRPLFDALAWLAFSSIAWASIGGGSSLFSLLVTPQIRTWSRMVVVIAFFAIAAALSVLQEWTLRRSFRRGVVWLLASIVTALAVVDQASERFQVHAPREYPGGDAVWMSTLPEKIGTGSAIFQYPPFPYPENGPMGSASDYDYFRPYLQTEGLRWSYGAARGSAQLEWQQEIAELSAQEMIERLSAAGFAALLVDRAALSDDDRLRLIDGAAKRLDNSPEGRWVLYSVPASELSPAERLGKAFGEPLLTLEEGISYLEKVDRPYHWASPRGSMAIHNLASDRREVVITLRANAAVEGEWQLSFSANGATGSLPLDAEADEIYRIRLTAPPGRTSLRFETTAPRLHAPGDPRVLAFRIFDPEIRIAAGSAAASG